MASGRCQLIFTAEVADKAELASASLAGGENRLTFLRNTAPISVDDIKDGFAFDGKLFSSFDT